jgi:hypothetical protein
MGLIDIILFLSPIPAHASIETPALSRNSAARGHSSPSVAGRQNPGLLLRTRTRPGLRCPITKHSPDLLTPYQARSLLRAPQAGMRIGFHSGRIVRVRQVEEAVGEREELVDVHWVWVCRWVIRLPGQSRLLTQEPQ